MQDEQDFSELFKAYLGLQLSAFDNLKLVTAVLTEHEQSHQCYRGERDGAPWYFVQWQEQVIECGKTNDYAASIALVNKATPFTLSEEIDVPVMSLQQVGYMCMEYAHFDHC